MVKFIHTADWQLDMTRYFLDDEAQARFSGARIDVIRRIGALAVKEGCEFVVVCGDVFESNQIGRQIVVRALDAMAATPEVIFYLLPGNHDPLDPSTVYRSPTFTRQCPSNVVVMESAEPIEVAAGVELIPAPWLTKRPLVDLVAEACAALEPGDAIRIVAGHGALDSISPNPGDPALISLGGVEQCLAAGTVHFVALGDRHSTTEVGHGERIWYAGAAEATDYDEVDPGNVVVVELDAAGVRLQVKAVGKWRYLSREWELTGERDIDHLAEWLEGLDDKDCAIVRLALVGQLSLAQKARLDDLLNHHSDLLAALETWERRSDLVVVPDEADMDDMGLSGFAREALGDLRALGGSGEQVVTARDALGLLYRLAEVGR